MAQRLIIRARIAAPSATIYRALTDADALRVWLAEHADVDVAAGRYVFWGRFTPQGEAIRQRLLAAEPDRLLRFAWTLDGVETTTELTLIPMGEGGSELTLTQSSVPSMDEMMAAAGGRDGLHTLHTFWGLAVANLAEYAEGRALTPKCDFSAARRAEIAVEVAVPAPPEQVFASLIEPVQIDRWFGGAAEVEPRVGGRISLFGGEPAETIREFAPPRLLAYTGQTDDATTVVRWELAPAGASTRLTLINSGYDPDHAGAVAQHEAGWLGALAELRRIHELGPDWYPLTVAYDLTDE